MFGVNFTGDAKYVTAGLEGFLGELKTLAAGGCSAEEFATAQTKVSLSIVYLVCLPVM